MPLADLRGDRTDGMSDYARPLDPDLRLADFSSAVLRALVPARELVRYPIDLRSATHGTGSFTRTFASYEPADR